MDVVVAPSTFIRHALLAGYDGGAVRDLAPPVYLPAGISADRRRWRIPERAVAFVCSFEMASDISRKNPFGAIAAFTAAFGGSDDAVLVVKVNNSKSEGGFAPHLEHLMALARSNPRVLLVDEVLSYTDVLSLFASCDVFVSLHRAEGLGLCLMEAMLLGKPVVTTAWSGNMDFTTEQNACLVGYDLVLVHGSTVHGGTQAAYSPASIGHDARWAEPRLDEAVQWLRRLAGDAQLRASIGARAAADMAAFQRRIDVGEVVAAVRGAARRRSLELSAR